MTEQAAKESMPEQAARDLAKELGQLYATCNPFQWPNVLYVAVLRVRPGNDNGYLYPADRMYKYDN